MGNQLSKRAAVCYRGHWKGNWRGAMESHKEKLFNRLPELGYQTDTFISTWGMTSSTDCRTSPGQGESLPIEEIQKLCSPAIFQILDYDKLKFKFHHREFQIKPHWFNGVQSYHMVDGYLSSGVSQSFLSYAVNQLKSFQENILGTKYDLVFNLRPDFKIDSLDIQINDKLNADGPYRGYAMGDLFAYGNSYVMDCYSSVYQNVHQLIDEYDGAGHDSQQQIQYTGFEQLLYRNSLNHKLEINNSNISTSRA